MTLCSLSGVERLIVARHAESEYNVQGLINADPASRRSPLTNEGIQQARRLAEGLAGEEIEVCVTSRTLQAVQTAEIVSTALAIPVSKTSLLDDPPAGIFEDGPVELFAEWMSGCDPDSRYRARRRVCGIPLVVTLAPPGSSSHGANASSS